MSRLITSLVLLAAAHAFADEGYRKLPCKAPETVAKCRQVHGRLYAANGTPAIRLWQIGTHHIYGIYSNQYGFKHDSPTLDNEAPELHFTLPKGTPDSFWTVYGDFEVCSLEPEIKGHMEAACIANATHVVAEKE